MRIGCTVKVGMYLRSSVKEFTQFGREGGAGQVSEGSCWVHSAITQRGRGLGLICV